jgi:MFS family permease
MKNNAEKKQFSVSQKVAFNKIFWPLYLLNSFQALAYGSLIVLVAPLSEIFWPGEPIHSLEMGILFSILAWSSAVGGLLFGNLIDRYSRKQILIVISIFRGIPMFLLGFGVEGGGINTWLYFLFLISIFGFFSGGTWPAVISLSNDVVPRVQRSRFFGVYEIIRNTTNVIGWLLATFIVQLGYWRYFFSGMGILILITLCIFSYYTLEPKRGAQEEELYHILKNGEIDYDFQINKKTIKEIMLSKTNIVALIEGIFTWVLVSSLNFLILNFIQNPPYNISVFSTAVFIVVFGLS